MTMLSPIVAMLWENWRLSRAEAAGRVGLFTVLAAAAMVFLGDNGPFVAFWCLLGGHAFFYFSIAKLNGGRFMDGYKPGFPLYLYYTRPVPTAVFVGVAMVYDAVSCAALYVVCAALLGFAFSHAFPLFSVAACLVAYHFAITCIQWSTRSRIVQWVGSIAVFLPIYALFQDRVTSPLRIEFSLAEYASMVSVGVVSFGLTVAGVARQRRGDAVDTASRTAGSGGYPDWMIAFFRFPCPTSSATLAQVWFELKSSGLPILAIGLAIGILIYLLFAIGISVEVVRVVAISVGVLSAPGALYYCGGNAFGIRDKQGRTYASTFEATQPYGTAQIAGLKILVRSACMLVALIAIGVSVWASSSLVGAWGTWIPAGDDDLSQGLLEARREFGEFFGGLPGDALPALTVVACIAVALTVAARAAFGALQARYIPRVNIAGALLLFCMLSLSLLGRAVDEGFISELLLRTILRATGWVFAATIVCATAYFTWRSLAERLLTPRHVLGIIVVLAAFGAAWLSLLQTLLREGGMSLAGLSATDAVLLVSPVLLPLTFSVLAPWALSRMRNT